jgi:hypothetical protein
VDVNPDEIMKANYKTLLSAVLILGLVSANLTVVPAQETNDTAAAAAEPAPRMSEAEARTKISDGLKEIYSDAKVGSVKKGEAVGTNDVYAVQFSAKGKKMIADVVSDGTVLEIEEPGDIKTFPGPANDAVRRAITSRGIKDLGVRVGTTYAEIQKDAAGESTVVKLSPPLTTYRADVHNTKGVKGKFSFKADGTLVQRPPWYQ